MSVLDDLLAIAPAGYAKTLHEVLASAPRGFPRPITDGLPTPWISREGDLGDVDALRRTAAVGLRLCQVCGFELGITARVYWRVGDRIVIDGAAVHPDHCAHLAERHCPELRSLEGQGRLGKATVLTASLQMIEAGVDEMPMGYAVPIAS